MTRILITGCSGLLGVNLIQALQRQGYHDIYGITEVTDYIASGVKVFHLDIRDRDRVIDVVEKIRPSWVFHLAAIANVGYSWKHPKITYEINFIGSSNLLEALEQHAPDCRILLLSTAELYSGSETEILDEKKPVRARSPYALSKAAMEMLGELYIHSRKMDIITLRAFNFTGPEQDRKFVASDFSWQIARIEDGRQEPVIYVGNLSAIRDISDVRDISRYIIEIVRKGKIGEMYNLCSGNAYSIQEVLNILLSLSSSKIAIVVDPEKFRPVDSPQLMGNPQKIRDEFDLNPEFAIEQTLSDLLNNWRRKLKMNPLL